MPGSGALERLSHRNEGLEVYITPSSNIKPNHFLGFAYCLAHPEDQDLPYGHIRCSVHLYSSVELSERYDPSWILSAEALKSDHLGMGFHSYPPQRIERRSIKISFISVRDDVMITSCGVCVLHMEDGFVEDRYISAPQPSSVILQELDNLESDTYHSVIDDQGDSNGISAVHQVQEADTISLDAREPDANEFDDNESCALNKSKAHLSDNSERRAHLQWEATIAFGLILCLVIGILWCFGMKGRSSN